MIVWGSHGNSSQGLLVMPLRWGGLGGNVHRFSRISWKVLQSLAVKALFTAPWVPARFSVEKVDFYQNSLVTWGWVQAMELREFSAIVFLVHPAE